MSAYVVDVIACPRCTRPTRHVAGSRLCEACGWRERFAAD